MEGDLTIESFAADLASAGKPAEQTAPAADSVPDAAPAEGDEASIEQVLAESEAQVSEEGEAQSEQPQADSEQAAEPVHEWTTANGETIKATESELRAGYLRQQDYTRKTQQHAETVRQTQAALSTLGQQQMQAVGEIHGDLMKIGAINAQIQAAAAQGLPVGDLKVELWQAQQLAQQKMASFQNAVGSMTAQQKSAAVSAAEQHLQTKFPDLTVEKVGEAFSHLKKLNPSESEIDLIRTNPRLAEMAILAGKWLSLQAKKPEVQNKVQKLPPKTTAPRAAAPSSKTDAALKAINSRRTFSTAEFAKLLTATR